MGQVRHGAPRPRAPSELQHEPIAGFARAAEPGTRHRPEDGREVAQAGDGLKSGPKEPRPTGPSKAEEATSVAFQHPGPLPLDDCLHAFSP